MGLTPLVEVANDAEMQIAENLGAKYIGINNKDITALERDNGGIEKTISLIKSAPKDAFIISESGISSLEDAKKVLDAGANAVLVGTAFWKGKFI
jgi:indole-3-glycerol phosphate synthase